MVAETAEDGIFEEIGKIFVVLLHFTIFALHFFGEMGEWLNPPVC